MTTPTETRQQNDKEILTPNDVNIIPDFAQSLATLFRLLGKSISAQHIFTNLGTQQCTPVSCQRVAQGLGMTANIVAKPRVEEISSLVLPCILLLPHNKSCVLISKNSTEASVIFPEHSNDPSVISLEKLQEEYSGYAFFGNISNAIQNQLILGNNLLVQNLKHWLWDLILHYRPLYIQILLASIFINILALIGPLFFMNVYDRVVPNLAFESLWVLGIGVILGYLFEFALRVARSSLTDLAGKNIDTITSTELMNKILTMKLEDKPNSSGALIHIMRELESTVKMFSANSLLSLFDVPFIVFFLIVLYYIAPSMILIPIIAIILLFATVFFVQNKVKKNFSLQFQASREKDSFMIELISGIEAIKMASAENSMLQKWERSLATYLETSSVNTNTQAVASNISTLVMHMASVSLIIAGVYAISDATLSFGGLIACNILLSRALSLVVQLVNVMSRVKQAQLSLKSLNTFMELPSERSEVITISGNKQNSATERTEEANFKDLPPSMELVQVSYSFANAHLPVLNNVSLRIRAGERVGIIGNMGSGKTTLLKLMVGLFDPTEGAARFGGVDLRRIDVTDLRSRIGYLSQEPVLFQGSVRENITLGFPYIQDHLVLRAAFLAGVTDFVRLHHDGFAMQVGERGSTLSGGQKQSVALARALLLDPDFIVLDEPSSNLDGNTEAKIKQRLTQILPKKTLVVSMHRMSLLSLVDRLIVVNNGRIIDDGLKQDVLERLNHG